MALRIPRRTLRGYPVVLAVAALLLDAGESHALIWNWNYYRPASDPYGPVLAAGMLRTTDSTDQTGYYTILAVSGRRNGVVIASLLPVNSSIPGNPEYYSDNLLRVSEEPMTSNGFNVVYVDDSFSNFFTATYLPQVEDLEFHTVPPNYDVLPNTELSGIFTAKPVQVPSPLPVAGVSMALAWSRRMRRRLRRRSDGQC